jgi:hypothetical protein
VLVGAIVMVIGLAPTGRAQYAVDTIWDPAWPPLPFGMAPARPVETIRAAYAFAMRRPQVLQYIPCYCGCENSGHKSNLFCYVKDGNTKAPQWDTHGYT